MENAGSGGRPIEIVFKLPGGPLAAHFARNRLPADLLPGRRAAVLELLLASRWGIDRTHESTTVWFALD